MNAPIIRQLFYIYDLTQLTGRSAITLRRWWTKGLFPTPKKINSVLVWHTNVIEAWLKQNIEGNSDE